MCLQRGTRPTGVPGNSTAVHTGREVTQGLAHGRCTMTFWGTRNASTRPQDKPAIRPHKNHPHGHRHASQPRGIPTGNCPPQRASGLLCGRPRIRLGAQKTHSPTRVPPHGLPPHVRECPRCQPRPPRPLSTGPVPNGYVLYKVPLSSQLVHEDPASRAPCPPHTRCHGGVRHPHHSGMEHRALRPFPSGHR